MAFIDLGELAHPAVPPPDRRWRRAAGRRMRRRSGSPWLSLALMAAVILLLLAGAVPPVTRAQAILPSSLAAQVQLTSAHIFAVTPVRGATDGSLELITYRRPEPAAGPPRPLAPQWRMPMGNFYRLHRAESVADAVLLGLAWTGPGGYDQFETLLLDARTGQQRWRRPGVATLDTSARVLLRTDTGSGPITLTAVELFSGRVLWSTTATWASHQARNAVVDAVVLTTGAGEIEVRDPGTGELRGRLPADDEQGRFRYVTVAGDLVLVVDDATALVAYDLDGLARRWQVQVPPTDAVAGCGVLICARAADGVVRLLDPATGAVRWVHAGGDPDVVIAEERRAVIVEYGSLQSEVTAVDATTGRTITDHGTWELVHGSEFARYLLGVRPVPDVGLVVARLDPAQPRPRRIDVLADAVGNCRYRADLITCRRKDGDFGVWQLRD